MEKEIKQGRPKTDATTHKKNRGISMKDTEYKKLQELAAKEKLGVSQYIIKKLKLNKEA